MERFFPVTPFDAAPIRAFLGLRSVVTAVALPGGRINSNYRVDLSDGTVVVVRYYRNGSPGVERFAMDLVKDRLPVPEILDAGKSWAVMRFLPGEPFAAHPRSARSAGRTLAAIASIEFPRPGRFTVEGGIEPWPFSGLAGFVRSVCDRPGAKELLGIARLHQVETLLETRDATIAEIDSEARLVHGDLNPTNILVRDGELTGVVDWEFAHAGSPWMDVGNLLRDLPEGYHGEVARGLAAGGFPLPLDWRFRAALVDFTSHLEFLTAEYGAPMRPSALARIDAFLREYSP